MEWVVRRLPATKAKFRSQRELVKLSKRNLAERCWAAEYTADCAMEIQVEAWANVDVLLDIIKGRRPIDPELIKTLDEHRAHVAACRTGICEHQYAVLVRDGLVSDEPLKPRSPESR